MMPAGKVDETNPSRLQGVDMTLIHCTSQSFRHCSQGGGLSDVLDLDSAQMNYEKLCKCLEMALQVSAECDFLSREEQ